eukprot:g77977.t1
MEEKMDEMLKKMNDMSMKLLQCEEKVEVFTRELKEERDRNSLLPTHILLQLYYAHADNPCHAMLSDSKEKWIHVRCAECPEIEVRIGGCIPSQPSSVA